jgi:ribosomal protein S18 acetylase RimI-like enzyme
MTIEHQPRLLNSGDAARAGHVLAQAFLDDPLNVYLYADARKRAARTPALYRFFASLGIASHLARGVGEPLASVAVWSNPASPPFTAASLLRAGVLGVAFSRVIFTLPKVFGIFSQFDRMQKQYAPEPHMYLQTIGTLPEAQGKGYGAALLRAMIAEADAARLPIYTETMTPENVGLYVHFGFEVMEDYRVPNTDLHLWGFKRPAQAADL